MVPHNVIRRACRPGVCWALLFFPVALSSPVRELSRPAPACYPVCSASVINRLDCGPLPTLVGSTGDWFARLLDRSDDPRLLTHGRWSTVEGRLHIISGIIIFLCHLTILLIVFHVIRRQRLASVPKLAWLFVALILASGLAHLMETVVLWWPAYRLSGLIMAVTAVASCATVIAMLPNIPKALALTRANSDNARLNEELVTRSRIEAELQAAQSRLESQKRALDEHAIVAITDPSGRITYVNQKFCDISKYSAPELIGQDHRIVNSRHHPKEFFVNLWRTIASGEVWHGEICNRAKDGSIYWVDTTIVPFCDESGRIVEYVAIRADITARKLAEEQLRIRALQLEAANAELAAAKSAAEELAESLERSNRELDDFAHIASHDLKEPLRGIHNYSTAVLEDYAQMLDADGRAMLETLPRLSQRLELFIDSLMEFSRLGRTELGVAYVDLNVVLADVLERLGVVLKESGTEVRVPEPLPTILCDRPRIGEVFYNLISNSLKYNDKPQKWIEVGVVKKDNRPASAQPSETLLFYVRDNGIGIKDKHKEMVFRLFKRLHRRDLYGGGTGAGLTIVRRIVERHGGRIWVESVFGEGTTFYFTLQEAGEDDRKEPIGNAAVTSRRGQSGGLRDDGARIQKVGHGEPDRSL